MPQLIPAALNPFGAVTPLFILILISITSLKIKMEGLSYLARNLHLVLELSLSFV